MASLDHEKHQQLQQQQHSVAAAQPANAMANTPPQGINAAPNSQTPGHPSFRRCVASSKTPNPVLGVLVYAHTGELG
jgi:hypothetical protein